MYQVNSVRPFCLFAFFSCVGDLGRYSGWSMMSSSTSRLEDFGRVVR